mmetsp:Transcript_115186/g.358714  ORF Transcript_115186/g.358714 Transcript_115186/m.358714 type:complete len:135 (-) Transcript_115186:29-433(-)
MALIMAGTNDLMDRAGAEDVFQSSRALLGACQASGVRSVALGAPDFDEGAMPKGQKAVRGQLAKRLGEWAAEAGEGVCLFVDAAELLPHGPQAVRAGLWERDGLHFSPAGSGKFAAGLAASILPLLLGSAGGGA